MSKQARKKGEEKKYIKKTITVSSQSLLPDDISSLVLVESTLLESYQILDSVFRAAIRTKNADVIRFLQTTLTKEQIQLLGKVSNDVGMGKSAEQ
jgi:hypothetical protein